MKLGDFGLFEDRQFVAGLVGGVGIGVLLGYGLGWDRTLGVGPGVMAVPCLVLSGVGQWLGWAAVVRRRATAVKSPQAEPDAAVDRTSV